MKTVKIGVSLLLVFILSFVPMLYAVNSDDPISGYFRFSVYVNNLANFFIYLFVDEQFRSKLRMMCSVA